jgi:hypothetical protein
MQPVNPQPTPEKKNQEEIMDKKLVALVTLIFFTLFSCQSYITKVVKTSEIPTKERESIKVLGLVTTANKWIEFEFEPGRLVLNTIVGDPGED